MRGFLLGVSLFICFFVVVGAAFFLGEGEGVAVFFFFIILTSLLESGVVNTELHGWGVGGGLKYPLPVNLLESCIPSSDNLLQLGSFVNKQWNREDSVYRGLPADDFCGRNEDQT